MAVSTIKTTQMTWGFLNSRLNREPIDAASLNNSYTDLLWELNQTSSTYEIGKSNTGGSSNFYVGLITSVPYVNKGHGQNEDSSLKGPWYVTYCGSDPNEGTGKYAFTGHISDPVNAANTYYADRIVLKRELDYALDKNTVSPLLLGTYYTGVGHWYDSYTKSKEYLDGNKELPDGVYFPTSSYAEIFNDYTNNIATGIFSHAEGSTTVANGDNSHAEGYYTITKNDSEHAQGRYNFSDTSNSGTLSTIGNGTSDDNRHNIVAIYNNGDVNTEVRNTTNYNTGYFSTTVDGYHNETVKGNYTQTIGTGDNTRNIIVNGTNNESVTGNSVIKVKGNTNLTVGSLDVTSGVSNLNLDKTHVHVTNELCLNSSTDADFKGINNTKIGQDFEGNKTNNFYIVSTATGNISSSSIELNADSQYTENVGIKNTTISGTFTENITGAVNITNKNNVSCYTYGNTYTYTHGTVTDTIEGNRTVISQGAVNITNENTSEITTVLSHTESIGTTRSITVGSHDSLVVSNNGRTEKITGDKITQVISGNINAYTDDTHNIRLNTRSTYIETSHTYIGDKTDTSITGNYSVGLGQGIKVSSNTNTTVGKYNKDESSYFSIGVGINDTSRKNAFWISQGNTEGTNGVGYFSNNTYIYGNSYDPGIYTTDKEKEDKSWSAAVTYNMYRNSYTYLYKTIDDKFNTFGANTYFTKSIDNISSTPLTNTIHYTTQSFNNKENKWPINTYTIEIPNAIPGALENDNSGNAGLMTARDKARLDSIWEGDKQIAGIQISTGNWVIYKNDGTTTYNLTDIKHQSNTIRELRIEYGFKPKWSGTWKWTVNNQKNAERCNGSWNETLPLVNTNSSVYTSPVLSDNGSGDWSEICHETIYAAKRGLIISGYPDNYAADSNGTRHLGSIVPAFGEDNRTCYVRWATYRLLFYGKCTQAEADAKLINIMSDLSTSETNKRYSYQITKRSWQIKYISDSNHCFFMAYPSIFGDISTIKKNGVEIITTSFLKVGSVNYTNGAGLTQQYNIYRSGVGSANMSITIS